MPHSDTLSPLFLTTKEVADLLRVKERKVYDLAAAEQIPHRRITGKLLFPANEIRAWIDGSGEQYSPDRPGVLAGSHDPLLDWALRASGCGLATLCNGSRDGLAQFKAGTAALAGIHLPEKDEWNIASVEELGLTNAVLIAWAVRKRGLLVSEELAGTIRTIADLKGKRVAMRQPGAGTAVLFASLIKEAGLSERDLTCSDDFAHTESDAAAAVASGEADASLGLEAMAKQFKLVFVPLADENFDLLIDRKSYFTEPVQKLFAYARTREFQDKAVSLGGYELTPLGSVRWLSA
ncbi:MAG: helix-turn-helix transcriptional regulator [Roseibium sp.]|uniref:helix-turn-helix transcriptional regulator n=1 Tax=Roseibium sp. TaxID=1936156 RepID=UPI00261018D4|nr:helix-turn-helix transcriptional regulator [Roseibium sp.]MCV0426006.1 helix-turn-helix transcriptional regulator [Roseibium sp.]